MTLSVKTLIMTMILALAMALSGCSSSSKTAEKTADVSVEDLGAGGEEAIELNGTSDGNKAGALRTVYFDFNSSRLRSDAMATLDANIEFLKNNPSVEVQIEGHCDERGGVQYNLALGAKRAKTVKNYFAANGIESARVTTISFGKDRPITFGHDEDAWAQNRRGNFVITAK